MEQLLPKIKIGSHVSMGGKEMLLGSAKEAASYGSDIFMAYTGAPQNAKRKPLDELRIEEAWDYMGEHGLSEIIVHAPYLINLANTVKEEVFQVSCDLLASEIRRAEAMKSRVLVLHPGSHVGAGAKAGIKQVCEGLNRVLRPDMELCVALETMAGKGGELGRSFEELAEIIGGVKYPEKLKVCFDTCHVHDSGYDLIREPEKTFEAFARVVGKDMIAVFHMNDSKNERGAAKDRHENYGFGKLGFDALQKIMYWPDYIHVPKILESPWVKDLENPKKSYPPYGEEIAAARSGVFDSEMIDKIRKIHNI